MGKGGRSGGFLQEVLSFNVLAEDSLTYPKEIVYNSYIAQLLGQLIPGRRPLKWRWQI